VVYCAGRATLPLRKEAVSLEHTVTPRIFGRGNDYPTAAIRAGFMQDCW